MTKKQTQFVKEYLIDLSATQAHTSRIFPKYRSRTGIKDVNKC